MSENESKDHIEQAVANLQREVMAMRQICPASTPVRQN